MIAHAERFYAEGRPPATPRVSATVVLLRPAPEQGFEVYAIRRATTMAFASGMYAFPGGSVDPADSAPVAWVGPTPQEWAERLKLSRDAAQAVVCAAVREVFEEAGVLLAGPGPAAVVGDVGGEDWEEIRQSLVARRTSLTAALADRRLAVRSDLLVPWSRWITPDFEPRRFDTYFFLAQLPAGQRTRDVSGEADHTEWITPAGALARHGAGEMAMLLPTLMVLRELAAYPDVGSALRAAADRDPATPVAPRLAFADDGPARFVLP
ncbi:MAG TPA: NUDIX hydrolase [Pilimelia sp.]|nr:NUDIX hydrolase [Pilimelia sp.]